MMYRIKGAILIGIFLTSIISWPRPTPVTYFPHTPAGDAAFEYFSKVVNFHKLEKVANALDVSQLMELLKLSLSETSILRHHSSTTGSSIHIEHLLLGMTT